MSKFRNLLFKIGWCDASALRLSKGHYVLIRSVKNGKCDVNTFTGLVDEKGKVEIPKIYMVQRGMVYPVPSADLNLPRFSGVDRRVVKGVPLSSVKDIGRYRLKGRHFHYIRWYMKK